MGNDDPTARLAGRAFAPRGTYSPTRSHRPACLASAGPSTECEPNPEPLHDAGQTTVPAASSACARDSGEDARALARPELLDMLGAERVREIGARYRAAVPNENSAAALRAAISDTRRQRFRLPWIWRVSIERQVRAGTHRR